MAFETVRLLEEDLVQKKSMSISRLKLEQAAAWIEDSLTGENPFSHGMSASSLVWRKFYYRRGFKQLRFVFFLALSFLPLIEYPQTVTVPWMTSYIAEAVILLFIFLLQFVVLQIKTSERYYSSKFNMIVLVISVISFLEFLVSVFIHVIDGPIQRPLRALRPILFFYLFPASGFRR